MTPEQRAQSIVDLVYLMNARGNHWTLEDTRRAIVQHIKEAVADQREADAKICDASVQREELPSNAATLAKRIRGGSSNWTEEAAGLDGVTVAPPPKER